MWRKKQPVDLCMSSKSREKRKEEKEKTGIEEIVMGRLTYAKYFCMSLHGVNPASIPCILKGSSNIVYRVRRKTGNERFERVARMHVI